MKSPNILVIGDCAIDYTLYGSVHGIAPEAPVPVLKVEREEYRLGMAANVAVQLSKHCTPTLWTFFTSSQKWHGHFLFLIQQQNIKHKHFNVGFPLTIKQRSAVGNTYISRNDFETVKPLSIVAHLTPHIKELKKFDAIILSDYGKSVIGQPEELIGFLKEHTKAKIFVDPDKFKKDYEYMKAYCIKANKKEGLAISEKMSIEDALNSIPNDWVIITDGDNGCYSVFDTYSKIIHHKGVKPKTIGDVIGAGDSFLASLVYHDAIGWSKEKSIMQANKDASKCVERFGV